MSDTIISFWMPSGAHVCTTVFSLKLPVLHLSKIFPVFPTLLQAHPLVFILEKLFFFCQPPLKTITTRPSLLSNLPSSVNYHPLDLSLIFQYLNQWSFLFTQASSTPLSYTPFSHSSQSKNSSHTACWYSSYSCSSFTLHLNFCCCTTCGGFACPILSSSTILYARGDVVLLVAVKFTFLHMPQRNMNFRRKDCSVACCIMNARNMYGREPLPHHSFQGCADVSSEWYCI